MGSSRIVGKIFFGHLVDRLDFEFFEMMLVARDTS